MADGSHLVAERLELRNTQCPSTPKEREAFPASDHLLLAPRPYDIRSGQETFVVPHRQLALDLLRSFEGHARNNDDRDAG
jgi:hypothetical protein